MNAATGLTAEFKYQLLLKIAQQVRDTLDLDEILNHLLDALRSVIAYDAAGIFVLNEDLAHARARLPRDLIAGIARRGYPRLESDSDPMLAFGEGIIGHVIKSGEAVIVRDVKTDPRYIVGRVPTMSEIAVPVFRHNRAIGALNLESDRLEAFGEDDVEILRFFADAAAISIEKAVLHRQLVRQNLIEEQLRTAREVQARLLPSEPPAVPGFEADGICVPSYAIGGDYFDFIPLPDGRLAVVIADVSGKGIPAALIMTAFRVLLRTLARSESEPADVMRAINWQLPESTRRAAFVTAVYGVLEPATGRFTYAIAGHHAPLLIRASGQISELDVGGPLLGMWDSARFLSSEVFFEPGDLILCFTDGVIETENAAGDQFGLQRLLSDVNSVRHQTAWEIIQYLLNTIREFSGPDCCYQDDFTLVTLKRRQTG